MKNELNQEIMILTEESIKDKIYILRGEKVMLDFELAEIYGYSTKAFNQQVKNNRDKFEGYMFQLTRKELDDLVMSKFLTSRKDKMFKGQSGGIRKLPYAFTESGIYMLMTVLRGSLATEQSRKLINIFRGMKDYIEATKQLTTVNEIISLTSKVYSHEKRIEIVEAKVEELKDNFVDESKYKEYVIMNGNKYEAYKAYTSIYESSKSSIIIVDDYISNKTIDLLRGVKSNVTIHLCSDNVNKLSKSMIEEISKESNITIMIHKTNDLFHDRFIVIDGNKVYGSGPSSKDAGNSIGTIHEYTNKKVISLLLGEINKMIKK